MAEESNTEVFVYTEGVVVPKDVVRVRVHSSVTVIPDEAFEDCIKLEEVELCEGLLEIRKKAFFGCQSLKKMKIPTTVTLIDELAFFNCGSITNFRIPQHVTEIPSSVFIACQSLFSIEIPEGVTHITMAAFLTCHLLRNVALPSAADIEDGAFYQCSDLHQLFGTDCLNNPNTINALKHRFDSLPIHKMIYYQSYNNVTPDHLNNITVVRISRWRSKLDPTGNLQDCLGMTPLHILACSTVQNIELYKVFVTKYPENLITEDRWGAVPLLYAVLMNAPTSEAPSEIVNFLVKSYKSLYPNHKFDWNNIVLTLARFDTLVVWNARHDVIRYVWGVQQESFPDQHFDWDEILEEAITRWKRPANPDYVSPRSFRHLVRLSTATRTNRMGYGKMSHFIHKMVNKVYTTDLPESSQGRRDYISGMHEHLLLCEEEYRTLKEAIALLELALWKKGMEDHCQEANEKRRTKRVKIEESASRQMCRVGCGADVVIEHVLPYLVFI